MVRRWSYISTAQDNYNLLHYKGTKCLSTYYNFKVFKKTTFFRKFKGPLSFFLRKKNIRRKRHTNLINTSYIIFAWIKSYNSLRKSIRYVQLQGILRFSRFISSWPSLQKNFSNFGYSSGALLTLFGPKKKEVLFSPSPGLLTDAQSNYTSVNAFLADNQHFYVSTNTTLGSSSLGNPFTKLWVQLLMKYTLTFRSVIILCSLLHLFYAIRKCSF